jgi:hypothetical protein
MRHPLAATVALGAALACGGPAPLTDCSPSGTLTPHCGFQNPEDVVVLGEWLLVSQSPHGDAAGSIVAFRPRDGARRPLFPAPAPAAAPEPHALGAPAYPGPPDPARFAPHGIDLAPDALLVVNHGGREAIEVLGLVEGGGDPALAWRGCVPLPDDVSANDVAALPEGGGFLATDFMPRSQIRAMFRLLAGLDTGRVLAWRPGDGWSPVPNTESRTPNGVEVAPDGRIFVAEWASRRVARVERDGSGRRTAALDFSPDNFSWRADGTLLVAGQRAGLREAMSCGRVEHGACALPSVVVALDPETLAVTPVLDEDPPTRIGAASVAQEAGTEIWVGSFASDRLVAVAKDAARPR